MMKSTLVAAGAAALLAGCGSGGPAAPDAVQGIWSADCSTPFVSFAGNEIHLYPDKATYPLKSAALQGANLDVTYETPQGAVAETYVLQGATLRLDHGTYGGQQAVWHKQPMSKCG